MKTRGLYEIYYLASCTHYMERCQMTTWENLSKMFTTNMKTTKVSTLRVVGWHSIEGYIYKQLHPKDEDPLWLYWELSSWNNSILYHHDEVGNHPWPNKHLESGLWSLMIEENSWGDNIFCIMECETSFWLVQICTNHEMVDIFAKGNTKHRRISRSITLEWECSLVVRLT